MLAHGTEAGPDLRQSYGNATISGSANVHQGNVIQNYTLVNHNEHDRELFHQLCYSSMNERRNQIATADEDTCDWIWDTAFNEWLSSQLSSLPNSLFWIRGKPGSGKSTLMKYLSKCPRLFAALPTIPTPWVILNFFFDFRQSKQVANSHEGLLRTMLNQILSVDRGLEVELQKYGFGDNDISLDTLHELLNMALNIARSRYLVLIDGLDEYEGNKQELLRSVRKWQQFPTLKVCLASRPDAVILGMLDASPGIDLSFHNRIGIQRYVQTTIIDCRPYLDELNLPKLTDTLVEKSQGLFLWVYLAVREVADACFMGATASEIEQILLLLPKDLEPFYGRIIDKLPKDRKVEAAMLFSIVSNARRPPLLERLFCIVDYLARERDLEAMQGVSSTDHFNRRMNATMGGLLETVPRETVNESICASGGHSLLNGRSNEEELILAQMTYQRMDLSKMHVRMLHETVRAFSRHTTWFKPFLPSAYETVLPDRTWARLCFKLLRTAHNRTKATADMILPLIKDSQLLSNTFWSNIARDIDAPWAASVIYFSKVFMQYLMENFSEADDDLRRDMIFVMRSRFARLHFLHHLQRADTRTILEHNFDQEYEEFIVAAAHHYWGYFYLNETRLSAMTDSVRDAIVEAVLSLCPAILLPCPCLWPKRATDSAESIRECIDFVLSLNRTSSEDHLSTYLLCGYQTRPRFLVLQKSRTTNETSPASSKLKGSELETGQYLTHLWLSQRCLLTSSQLSVRCWDNQFRQCHILRDLGVCVEDYHAAFKAMLDPRKHVLDRPIDMVSCVMRVIRALYLLEYLRVHFNGGDILRKESERLLQKEATQSFRSDYELLISVIDHKSRRGHFPRTFRAVSAKRLLTDSLERELPDRGEFQSMRHSHCFKCEDDTFFRSGDGPTEIVQYSGDDSQQNVVGFSLGQKQSMSVSREVSESWGLL